MDAPRDWKRLQRDPLSTARGDIDRSGFDRMVDRFKRFGWVGTDQVKLRKGDDGNWRVFSGWQRLKACQESGIVPPFEEAVCPEGMTWEEYAELLDDIRRHSSTEAVAERRARVIAARAQGLSVRAIAEAEGVSNVQVRRDLAASTVPGGGTVAPPPIRVVGLDGKSRPATKPQILCDRCQRVGPVAGCKVCESAREAAKKKKGREPGQAGGKPRRQSGKVKFDWKKFETAHGLLLRTVGDAAEAYGQTEAQEYRQARRLLEGFHGHVTGWKETLLAAKGATNGKA